MKMINKDNELVMELMFEEKSDLKIGEIYKVKLGNSERKLGFLTKPNRKGSYKIFVNPSRSDRIFRPRIYSFKNYSLNKTNLDIPNPSNPKIFFSKNFYVDSLSKRLEKLK